MSDSDDDEPPMLVELGTSADAAPTNSTPTMENPVLSQQPQSASDLTPCPVTILSGFLGSGKTTLIQYILKSPDHKYRIAVIENEFGEGLEIESMIAKNGADNSSLADFIELPNGCVCCTVKDNLVVTLETLLEKRKDLDYILIEASGMANPGPIASVFWLDDELQSRIRLDGIVTLVDAHNILQQLKETEEAAQQIAYADRLLVNKADLVESTQPIVSTIQQMAPAAQIQTTSFSQVPDLKWILDTKSYEDNQGADKIGETVEQVAATTNATESHDHSHDHGHNHNGEEECTICDQQKQVEHSHTGAVTTFPFVAKGSIDYEKLNAFLATTLWPNQDEKDEVLRSRLEQQLTMKDDKTQPPSPAEQTTSSNDPQIFRIKGVVSIRRDPQKTDSEEWEQYCDPQTGLDRRWYIVQAVYDLWEIYPTNDVLDLSEDRECKLVIIGRHLRQTELKEGLQACLV